MAALIGQCASRNGIDPIAGLPPVDFPPMMPAYRSATNRAYGNMYAYKAAPGLALTCMYAYKPKSVAEGSCMYT
jgi:hypothetical protein